MYATRCTRNTSPPCPRHSSDLKSATHLVAKYCNCNTLLTYTSLATKSMRMSHESQGCAIQWLRCSAKLGWPNILPSCPSSSKPLNGSDAAATPPKGPRGGGLAVEAPQRQLRRRGPHAAAASQRKRCGGTPAQKGPREGPSKRQRCGGAPAERGSAAAKLQRRRCGGNSTGGLNAPASQRERCSGNSAEEAPRGGGLATEATRRQLRPRGVSRRRLAAATTRQDPR